MHTGQLQVRAFWKTCHNARDSRAGVHNRFDVKFGKGMGSVQMGVLSNQVAVVTGASHGIGEAIARRLASDGAKVVVNYNSQSEEEAAHVVESILALGQAAVAVKADVSDPSQVESLFDSTEQVFGKASLLVNNAALRGKMIAAQEIKFPEFEEMFRVNVGGPILCIGAFARRCSSKGGHIVNISSGQARLAMPGAGLYAGTKGALESVTRVFAADLGAKGINVNAVAPGATGTDQFNAHISDKARQETISNTAFGRIGTPQDIADVVSFLLSQDSHWVTGQVLDVNGGLRRS